MACGGRVWKGDTITISVPFDVSGYTDLTISYYTDGEMKVVKSESDVEIEDGFITYTFLPGELDTIADGVIRYQIDYSVDNVDYVTGTNTMSYLKTPKTYSAKTTEEYYEEGFSSGYTQGEEVGYASGHTDGYTEGEVVGKTAGYVSGYTEGHEIGYEEGHAQGKQDGEEIGYNDAVSAIRNQSISLSVSSNGVYTANTEDSIYFSEVNVNVPQGSGGTCNLQAKSQSIDGSGTGLWNIYPDAGYDGMESVTVIDDGYGQAKFEEGHAQGKDEGYESGHYDGMIEGFESGYTAGQADCSGSSCNLTDTWIDLQNGDDFEGQGVDYCASAITPSYDGWYKVHVQDKDYGQSKNDEGFEDGYNSAFLYLYPDAYFNPNMEYFCPTNVIPEVMGATYSVELFRNNGCVISGNPKGFIIFSSDCGDCTGGEFFELCLTDDNVLKFALDDDDINITLSAQTYGEYIHVDIIFSESGDTVTMNVSNHTQMGNCMATSVSGSGFNWGDGSYMRSRTFCINGYEGAYENRPMFTGITYWCNIIIESIKVFNLYGSTMNYLKYRNGGLYDCINGVQLPFKENYFNDSTNKWDTRDVEIMKCIIGQGGV